MFFAVLTFFLFMFALYTGWAPINLAAKGKLLPNATLGILTRTTVSSDEAWIAAHRAALPIAKWARNIGTALLILGIIIGAVMKGQREFYADVMFFGCCAFILIAATIVGIVANRAAKEVAAASAPKS